MRELLNGAQPFWDGTVVRAASGGSVLLAGSYRSDLIISRLEYAKASPSIPVASAPTASRIAWRLFLDGQQCRRIHIDQPHPRRIAVPHHNHLRRTRSGVRFWRSAIISCFPANHGDFDGFYTATHHRTLAVVAYIVH